VTENELQRGRTLQVQCNRMATTHWLIETSRVNNLKFFNECYPLARSKGLVIASIKKNEEILIFTASEEWVQLLEVLSQYPLETLRFHSSK